jgi:hypothetical protein
MSRSLTPQSRAGQRPIAVSTKVPFQCALRGAVRLDQVRAPLAHASPGSLID